MVHGLKGSSQRSWVHHLGKPHTGGSMWRGDSPPHARQNPHRSASSCLLSPSHKGPQTPGGNQALSIRACGGQIWFKSKQGSPPCWAGKTERTSKAGHGKATTPPWLPRPPMLTLLSPSATHRPRAQTHSWGSALTFFHLLDQVRDALNSQGHTTAVTSTHNNSCHITF